MRYLCVHCEHRFDAEEPPQRCPTCMRATGVQPVRDEPPARAVAQRSPKLLVAVSALVLAAAVAGYFAWGRRPEAGEESEAGPLSSQALHATLQAHAVDAGELERILTAPPAVASFAKSAAGEASTASARAEAVIKAIRARASALAFVPWSLGEPRTTPIGVPEQTLATLNKDRGRAQLYPLELATLAVAALRSVGVPAMVAELVSLDQERAPLDPSGYLGYFVVAVYPEEPGLGTPHLFDPYGGRVLPANAKSSVLPDPRVVGATLATRALHEISYLADPKRALTTSSQAIELAGSLPSVRTVRAMVVLGSRQVEQGLAEFTAARQLRGDAPRLHNLASAELMTGDVERALKDLQRALELAPEFAAAHATAGSLALVRGEAAEAEAELAQAEKASPDLSLVQWARAELVLREGDREGCLTLARRALTARPSFDAYVRMGVLLRQMARFDELREVAKQLLTMAPSYRQAEVRELITGVLGPAALDADARDPEAEEAAAAPPLELTEPTLPAKPADPADFEAPPPHGQPTPDFKLRPSGEPYQLKLGR